jgi:hypothetical protein
MTNINNVISASEQFYDERSRFNYLEKVDLGGFIFRVDLQMVYPRVSGQRWGPYYHYTKNREHFPSDVSLQGPGWISMTKKEAYSYVRKKKLEKLNSI